jgi:hypothetical protein
LSIKEVMLEWKKFLNSELLIESKIDDIKKEFVSSSPQKVTEEEWDFYINNPDPKIRNKLRQDAVFLDIVHNTLKEGKHSMYDVVSLFKDYLIHVLPQFSKGEDLTVRVPGGSRINLKRALEEKTASYDDLLKYLEAKNEIKLNTKLFIKCLNESNFSESSGNTKEFDVIVNESSSDWIVCYPRTIKGSISLSRSYWNGSRLVYDTTFNKEVDGSGKHTGNMTWCTSTVSERNMFLNYHRQLNLHMYYCIRKSTSKEKNDYKMCVSFAKKGNNISLQKGTATVNVFNNPIDETKIKESLGDVYDIIYKDAEKDDKQEITPEEYYKSITLVQFKDMKKANESNLDLFVSEARQISNYSIEGKEIAEYLYYQDNVKLKNIGINSKSLDSELIRSILEKEQDQNVIKSLLQNLNCPIDIVSSVINKEHLFNLEFEYDFEIEEMRERVCFNIISTNKYDKLDYETKKSFTDIIENQISEAPEMFIDNFYVYIGEDERKNKSVYQFFVDFPFEMLSYNEKEMILQDKYFPNDMLNIFFEKILPESSAYQDEFFAKHDIMMIYNAVINHEKLPIKMYKRIYDITLDDSIGTPRGKTMLSLALAKCKRVPVDILENLYRHEDKEVSKEAKKNKYSKHPLIIAARKDDIEEEELLEISKGRSFRQKYEITKRKDLNTFNKETIAIVLRNIIESGKLKPRLLVSLSERSDLKDLGLETIDLKNIYDYIDDESYLYNAEEVKKAFSEKYVEVLNTNENVDLYLRKYIKLILR